MESNDEKGINSTFIYNCGCGKRYCSFSNLYNHVKNKHNNDPPQGTHETIFNKDKTISRGRPKVVIISY